MPHSKYWHVALYKALGPMAFLLYATIRFYFMILLGGGGKWNESAQCVHKHTHLGGSGGMLPQENFNFTAPEIASGSF